jgi:flagellar biosynthetic protein FlhB
MKGSTTSRPAPVGIVAHTAQGGLRFSPGLLAPKPSKLNPLPGLKRMFGTQGLWEAAKALLKAAILGFLTYRAVRGVLPTLLDAGRLPLGALLATVSRTTVTLLRTAGLAGLVLALADYAMQRRRVGKSLMMSKQDIKDENKQSEGDPQVKGQIRARQLAMSRNRMMADVAKADVVVVNPTHVAVALRYDAQRGAPRVVAKGAGRIAARIREEAERHRVPMVRDVPLARTIYRACEIGEEIPPELYAAVARVLAFILALRARGSARRPAPSARVTPA